MADFIARLLCFAFTQKSICMFIPSRVFAYLPLSPLDRAFLLNKSARAVGPLLPLSQPLWRPSPSGRIHPPGPAAGLASKSHQYSRAGLGGIR